MTESVAVVDTGCANIASVVFAFERLGVHAAVTSEASQIASASRVVLPGVGSAGAGMKGIRDLNLESVIKDLKCPVLGICLGMQMMATESAESNTDCLGIFETTVEKLSNAGGTVLPHMGWNTVDVKSQSKLFGGIPDSSRFYFVHSYALPVIPDTTASCMYGSTFSVAVERENFFGVQFHPERSGSTGSKLLENFVGIQL
ncbi:MAG: imidazole glycerol phosphate synthase subunit HisH [Rhodothermales bacterium]|nr:imidazole glycerol phosphate synthase subunit HisH [Rhodothermales bacterium]